MRIFLAALIALLLGLNYLLWMTDDRGLRQMRTLERAVTDQKTENAVLTDRNKSLEAEVRDLKEGIAAIEERARAELGMVRRDETFYRILDEAPSAPPSALTKPGTAVHARPSAPATPAAPAKPAAKPETRPGPRAAAPARPRPPGGGRPAADGDGVPDREPD